MAQKMLFCFTNISAKILLHVLSRSFCTEHHILAHFCQMLLPLKSSEMNCAKSDLLWHQKMLMKLTPCASIYLVPVVGFKPLNKGI
jgi:hypothetical protein